MFRDQAVLRRRAAIFRTIRSFFDAQGFLEVETPVLQPAPIPEAHIELVPTPRGFLQASPELCMKRLLAAGLPAIYQLCRVFRDHERGDRHLPEFTLLEWYRADADYRSLMADCRALFLALDRALGLGGALSRNGQTIRLDADWQELTVAQAFSRFAPVSLEEALAADSFEEILCQHVEPCLGTAAPCFLTDYPAALGSLARRSAADPTVVERFELYINGIELANGFSELTDPAEQRLRFEAEQHTIRTAGRDPGPMPEQFLRDLAHMPEAAGIALGVDRLVLLFTGAASIDQVVAFTPEDF